MCESSAEDEGARQRDRKTPIINIFKDLKFSNDANPSVRPHGRTNTPG